MSSPLGTGAVEAPLPEALPALPARNHRLGPPLVVVGWSALVPIVAGYFITRTSPGHLNLVLSQVLYLIPVAGAFAATALTFRAAPEGTERTIWGLIALAALLLFLGESYYAWALLMNPGGLPLLSVYDLLNLGAAIMFGAVIVLASGVSHRETTVVLQLVCDAVAVLSVSYVGVYHFWVRHLAPNAPWVREALLAAYSVVGLAIMAGLLWLLWGMPTARHRGYSVLVAISIAMFALGMMLSPVWQISGLSGDAASGATMLDAAIDSFFLCGYYLIMMAGLVRLGRRTDPWAAVMSRPLDTESTWPGTLLSAVVLVAIALMGRWAYGSHATVGEVALYVVFATLATIALVARVAVSSFETGSLQAVSSTDPVTGALNHRAFLERSAAQIRVARKRHERFAVALLDLDVFAGVNTALGHAGGDRVLRQVARALNQSSGQRGTVFRLSGDEFAVLSPGVEERTQFEFGTELLEGLAAAASIGSVPLSASVGVVMGDGASTPEMLLQRAGAAQAWAKYHGKGRVVVYDESIVRALGIEDRLRLYEERAHVDVARALAAAADARDPHNFYHSRNVAALAVLLSQEIGLESERVREIEIAALLHDVGKIALSDELLGVGRQSAPLERAAHEHSALGAQLVESLAMDPLPDWIRAHHERWDGGGFPDHLAGSSIPIESRIIALADAYDVLTNGELETVQMSKAAALQEIDLGMGTRFDPELAERFIRLVARTRSLGWSDEWQSR